MTPELEAELEYLEEVLTEYERFVDHIGQNGMAAPLLMYYRDEVQESIDELEAANYEAAAEEKIDLQPYWVRISRRDAQLRGRAPVYVQEVGHANFKQYQIVNDPPVRYWWWYLNRQVAGPPLASKRPWEFWK